MKQAKVQVPGGVLELKWNGTQLFRWSWKRQLLPYLLHPPFRAEQLQYSLIASLEGQSQPSERLLDLAIAAIQRARQIRLETLNRRTQGRGSAVAHWPGDHYRLLAALTAILQPQCIVEIGTGDGGSALAMKEFLPPDGRMVTFDIIPWQQMPNACLRPEDLADQRLVQYTDDLSDPAQAQRHDALFRKAELIFIDATKDGVMEPKLVAWLHRVPFTKPPIVGFDDIRFWNMLKVWRDIPYPKLDLTSFGHWSGTGLVEWGKA